MPLPGGGRKEPAPRHLIKPASPPDDPSSGGPVCRSTHHHISPEYRLSPWEQRTRRALAALRLESIQNKILALALGATLVPTLTTAVVTYVQNTGSLTASLNDELAGRGVQTAQELDLWVRQRFYDAGVVASSYMVSESLERLGHAGPEAIQAGVRLADYVTSVAMRFPDYPNSWSWMPRVSGFLQ